jgi:hypothetical protein
MLTTPARETRLRAAEHPKQNDSVGVLSRVKYRGQLVLAQLRRSLHLHDQRLTIGGGLLDNQPDLIRLAGQRFGREHRQDYLACPRWPDAAFRVGRQPLDHDPASGDALRWISAKLPVDCAVAGQLDYEFDVLSHRRSIARSDRRAGPDPGVVTAVVAGPAPAQR